jgi:hypothetical protein
MTPRNNIAKALDRLAKQVAGRRQAQEQDHHGEDAERQRWEETLNRFGMALPGDLRDRVIGALGDRGCLLWGWIGNLVRGRCRLPECLTEDVMRALVLILLDEAERCNSFQAVCLRCGLQYPTHKPPPLSEWKLAPGCSPDERPLRYDLPHFFEHDGCPACGASSKAGEMNWAHLMGDGYWFAPRATELPGQEPKGQTGDDAP